MYSSHPPFPSPTLVFQTVSINKAINTQEVAVKEKHARNILLDVTWKTDPEEGQIVGTEVRARRPHSAAGRGVPTQASLLQDLKSVAGGSWPQRPWPVRLEGTEVAIWPSPSQLTKDLALLPGLQLSRTAQSLEVPFL